MLSIVYQYYKTAERLCLKKLFAFAVMFACFTNAQSQFVTVWKGNVQPSSLFETFSLPIRGTDLTISWIEEGNPIHTGSTTISSADNGYETINYSFPGITQEYEARFIITITGNLTRFNAEEITSLERASLLEIRQWGNAAWTTMQGAFANCPNLQLTATDAPNLTNLNDMSFMFANCSAFTGHSSMIDWDTRNVTLMNFMFSGCSSFNADISSWKTENVQQMPGMFKNATVFNADIGNWNTAKVRSMSEMFSGATAFNQNLGRWNLSEIWVMEGMLDNSGITCENYDRILHGWAEGGTASNGVGLGAAGRSYSANYGVMGRNTLIDTYGWFIEGDTHQSGCNITPLPVTFGDVIAVMKNGKIQINWTSLTETNNSYFIVEASTDGKHFTAIGTAQSKATGVNRSNAHSYSLEVNSGSIVFSSLAGIVVLGLFLPLNRKRRNLIVVAILVCMLGFIGCSKIGTDLKIDNNPNLFIRIAQVDKDGAKTYSKIVQVYAATNE